jgi:hypothetical protein
VTRTRFLAFAACAALALTGSAAAQAAKAPNAATIAARVTGVAPARALSVGEGTAQPLRQIQGPFLRADGKPLVLYVGAEFCSYCAAERWAIVNALGRFGTFTGLSLTASTTDDEFPATPSFSFHGSTYTSRYLAVQTVELSGNVRGFTGDYPTLEKPTPRQQNIAASLDKPPYAPESGSIPFIVIAGRFVLFSSQYTPAALQGLDAAGVSKALGTLSSPPARGILGAANWFTASLCEVTKGKPKDVCSPPTIRALRKQFIPNP